MTVCAACGEDMHGRPTIWGRCGDCHRAHMRLVPKVYEERARESEAWREGLRKEWDVLTHDTQSHILPLSGDDDDQFRT